MGAIMQLGDIVNLKSMFWRAMSRVSNKQNKNLGETS